MQGVHVATSKLSVNHHTRRRLFVHRSDSAALLLLPLFADPAFIRHQLRQEPRVHRQASGFLINKIRNRQHWRY